MIGGYLRQGYKIFNLQEKNEKNVIVVIIVPCKCFDHTGVHGRVIEIELKTKQQRKRKHRPYYQVS